MTRRFNALSAGAMLTTLALLSGCASDGPRRVDTVVPTLRATSPAPSTTPASPSPSTEYTAVAATGQLIPLQGITAHGPAGWQETDIKPGESSATVISPDFGILILVSTRAPLKKSTIDEQADANLAVSGYDPKPKKVQPVTIAGQQWFHLAGEVNDGTFVDEFGTAAPNANEVKVVFEFMPFVKETDRVAVRDSVLASVALT